MSSLLLGLGAAGCTQAGGPPVAQFEQSEPLAVAKPALPPAPDDQRERVVEETVRDEVDRVDQILADRARAKQAAEDLRELRAAEAEATPSSAKDVADPVAVEKKPVVANAVPDEPDEIERLVATLRKRELIDETPAAPAKPADPAERPVETSQATANGTGPSAIDDEADGDYGDERPSGMAVAPLASMASDTRRRVDRRPVVGPVAPDAAADRASTVDPLLLMHERYAGKVAADPRDIASQLDLQILRFLRGDAVPEMADLSPLPAEDRELLAAFCDALSNFRSVVRDGANVLGSEKARPFIDMADRMRNRSDLTLSSLTLCEAVQAYGNYEPVDGLTFTAGAPRQTVLYCEVDGFLAQLDAQQRWETRLSLELMLFDERGMQVWHMPAEPVVDRSRKRRRDFFIAKMVVLPASLRPGKYLLKASVKDVQANRIAQSTIQLSVAPK